MLLQSSAQWNKTQQNSSHTRLPPSLHNVTVRRSYHYHHSSEQMTGGKCREVNCQGRHNSSVDTWSRLRHGYCGCWYIDIHIQFLVSKIRLSRFLLFHYILHYIQLTLQLEDLIILLISLAIPETILVNLMTYFIWMWYSAITLSD
jgi:hypothetical protein